MPPSSVSFQRLVQELTSCRLRVTRRQGDPRVAAASAVRALHDRVSDLKFDSHNVEDVTLAVEMGQSLRVLLPMYKKLSLQKHSVYQPKGRNAVTPSRIGSSVESQQISLPSKYLLDDNVRYKLESIFAESLHSPLAPTEDAAGLLALALGLQVLSEVSDLSRGGLVDATRAGFQRCYQVFELRGSEMTTRELLDLLRACHGAYVSPAEFRQGLGVTMTSLLPTKQKLHMEAHVQRCLGSRRVLHALRDRPFSQVDTSVALDLFASTGLYDRELLDRICSLLATSAGSVGAAEGDRRTALRAAKHLYNLGVLNHRHEGAMHALGTHVHPWKLSTEGVRELMLGLAMLRFIPPLSPTRHAASAKPTPDDPLVPPSARGKPLLRERTLNVETPGEVLVGGLMGHAFRQAIPGTRSDIKDTVDLQWYVDVCHATRVLGLVPHKLLLKFARDERRNIRHLDLHGTLKVLYAFGGVDPEADAVLMADVPLRNSWNSKAMGMLRSAASTLQSTGGNPAKGAAIMNALSFCNIRDHPLVPKVLNLDRIRVAKAGLESSLQRETPRPTGVIEMPSTAAAEGRKGNNSPDPAVGDDQQLPSYKSYSCILDDVMRTWCGSTGKAASPTPQAGSIVPQLSSCTREDEILAALSQFHRVSGLLATETEPSIVEREVADVCLHLANVAGELEPHEACGVLKDACQVAAMCGTSTPPCGLLVVMFEVAVAPRVMRRLWELRQVLERSHCETIRDYVATLNLAVLPKELTPMHEALIRRVSDRADSAVPPASAGVGLNETQLRKTMEFFVAGRIAMSDA